jgi:hypothetical protein
MVRGSSCYRRECLECLLDSGCVGIGDHADDGEFAEKGVGAGANQLACRGFAGDRNKVTVCRYSKNRARGSAALDRYLAAALEPPSAMELRDSPSPDI